MGIQRFDVDEHGDINQTEDGIFVNANDHFREITRLRAELAAKSTDVQTLVEASRAHLNGEYHDPETEGKSQYRVRRVKEAKALAEAIDSAMGEGNGR